MLDQNIPPDLAADLRAGGADVTTVSAEGPSGLDDSAILDHARIAGRVVVTQDRGFGRLVLLQGSRCPGVIILRPGHIDKSIIVDTRPLA